MLPRLWTRLASSTSCAQFPDTQGSDIRLSLMLLKGPKQTQYSQESKKAHEYYDYPGSHRTGSVISDGVVVRSYSTGEIDTISADESEVKYKIKTKALNDAFKLNKSEQIPVRFFLKKSDGVRHMGLYSVTGVRKKIATLTKMMKSNPIIPHNYIKAMDEGWTGFPTWAIQPTFSISDLQGNPPKRLQVVKRFPSDTSRDLQRKRWKLQSRKSTRATSTMLMIQKHTNTGSRTSKQQQEGTKPFQASTRRSSSRCTVHFQKKGSSSTKLRRQRKSRNASCKKVYDKGLAAWRTGHRPGVQQHQWAAGHVYSFVTLGNTVVKGKKKMSDYTLAVEAGLIKDGELIKKNPLKVITSNIITISGRSGSGKSTIAKGIKKRLGRDARIVPSYMTRKKRTNEKEPEDGVFHHEKEIQRDDQEGSSLHLTERTCG